MNAVLLSFAVIRTRGLCGLDSTSSVLFEIRWEKVKDDPPLSALAQSTARRDRSNGRLNPTIIRSSLIAFQNTFSTKSQRGYNFRFSRGGNDFTSICADCVSTYLFNTLLRRISRSSRWNSPSSEQMYSSPSKSHSLYAPNVRSCWASIVVSVSNISILLGQIGLDSGITFFWSFWFDATVWARKYISCFTVVYPFVRSLSTSLPRSRGKPESPSAL